MLYFTAGSFNIQCVVNFVWFCGKHKSESGQSTNITSFKNSIYLLYLHPDYMKLSPKQHQSDIFNT